MTITVIHSLSVVRLNFVLKVKLSNFDYSKLNNSYRPPKWPFNDEHSKRHSDKNMSQIEVEKQNSQEHIIIFRLPVNKFLSRDP